MGRRTKREEGFEEYRRGFEEGYEQGMSRILSHLKYEIAELEESGAKKVLDKIKDWMWKNYEEYIPNFGYDEPSKYEMKFCFVRTYTYRDINVDIFCDDNGQCYYFYYGGKCHTCGSFNSDYESVVKYTIDHDLDYIANFGKVGYYGGICKYANWEHTKVDFIFRGELIETFDVDENDPESVVKIWQECERRLKKLWENPEFIKAEESRKAGGNLYFSEMLEDEEAKLKEESGN